MDANQEQQALRSERVPYSRPFSRPLRAAWGEWRTREGILLRLGNPLTGRAGFGEAAPLPGNARPGVDARQADRAAMTFAHWSAEGMLSDEDDPPASARTAALLSLDASTPAEIERLYDKGYATFKLKLGIFSKGREWKLLQALCRSLNKAVRLRLDPNRSWSQEDWSWWQPRLGDVAGAIEFIEEPFRKGSIPSEKQLEFMDRTGIPFALDESLIEDGIQEWLQIGWTGYWVVKPSLSGNPADWVGPLKERRGKVVLSSAFETGIGMTAILRLAREFPGTDHGLGTQAWFDDDLGAPQDNAVVHGLSADRIELIWKTLSES